MRRRLTVIGSILAVGMGTMGYGQQRPGQEFLDLFGLLDANGDKVIEKSEVPEKGREAFDRLLKAGDSNADGRLEQGEYRDALRKVREAGAGATAGRQPGLAMDKNGDGKVDRDEFRGPAPLFDRLDADKNDTLNAEELRRVREQATGGQGRAGGGALRSRLKEMDKDSDRRLSRDEFQGPAFLFRRLDQDQDGFIDANELRSARPEGSPAAKKALGRRPSGSPASSGEPSKTPSEGTVPGQKKESS